jgi:hypothetical protein
MHPSRNLRPAAPTEHCNVIPLLPAQIAEEELEWFFTLTESDMGARSNYMEMLVPQRHREHHDAALERRVGAATARRTILDRLERIEGARDSPAGVLQAAYAPRAWPLALREELGRLTGIVVRLASAEAGLPDDQAELELLEQRTAERLAATLAMVGRSGLQRLRASARARYGSALRAYVKERGDGPSVLGRWA